MPLLIPSQKISNFSFTPLEGPARSASEFDQKSHFVLLNAPDAPEERLKAWDAEIQSKNKTWNWLGIKVFVLKTPLEGAQAGLLIVDRWGIFVSTLPLGPEMWDQLEKEMMYYEARHC